MAGMVFIMTAAYLVKKSPLSADYWRIVYPPLILFTAVIAASEYFKYTIDLTNKKALDRKSITVKNETIFTGYREVFDGIAHASF
jgi:hypothetical protein